MVMQFFHVQNSHDGEQADHTLVVQTARGNAGFHHYKLCLKLQESGYYFGSIKYNGRLIQPNNFELICLTGKIINCYYYIYNFEQLCRERITVGSDEHSNQRKECFLQGKGDVWRQN